MEVQCYYHLEFGGHIQSFILFYFFVNLEDSGFNLGTREGTYIYAKVSRAEGDPRLYPLLSSLNIQLLKEMNVRN